MRRVGEPESLASLLERLTAQQAEIAAARPLPEPTLRSLLDDFTIRFAHETTAIEGNTLTLHETQVVLENGITIGGKTLREHLEVVNIRTAWEAVQDLVRHKVPLTEEIILGLHRGITQGILGPEAGRYRTQPVYLRGSMHVLPDPTRVPQLMADFVEQFRDRRADDHPIRYAARAHIHLAGIHPLIDGNGRVSRMVVNLLLMRDGYPPALYTMTNRSAYLQALETAQFQGDIDPFVRVTAQASQFMIDRFLHAIAQVREGAREEGKPSEPRPAAHERDKELDR